MLYRRRPSLCHVKTWAAAVSYGSDNRQVTVPSFGRLWFLRRSVAAVGHLADEGEEGEVHGDDDAADGDAEEADHDRLDEGQKGGDGRVHLLLVEVGDLAEHGVERARLFADGDHLRDHVGEDVGRLQRLDDRLAALDAR